jgi:peptide/nickel transport system substrate-binding protein
VADIGRAKLTRRDVVKTSAAGAAFAAGASFARPGGVSAQDVPDVPRERTLLLRWGSPAGTYVDHELWNGYALGANHQNGLGLFYEPLAFYSAFANETIPWLAESWSYNEDSTQLTITTRSGISWSDGTPFTAEDVAFTIRTVRDYGPEVRFGQEVQPFVTDAVAENDTTVIVSFTVPAPRFMYFMTYKYDTGLYIVPKHIYDGQDWTTFQAYDIPNGLPVTTGPWRLVFSSPEQKVIDRADSWWAVDQGLVSALPQVERVVYLPFTAEEQVAQQLIANEIDCSLDLRPLTLETILVQNPNITTHTGSEKPYGYVDWWPTSLYVNCETEPFTDPNVRWALSYFIDRQQVIDVALAGAGSISQLPLPTYPGLVPFIEGVSDLLETYNTTEFNPEKGAELLTAAGWAKDGDFWAKDGQTLTVPIESFTVMSDIGPVIAEQLRQQGVDASFALPPDFSTQFTSGNYTAGLFGHGGSVSDDPYFTLVLYQSRSLNVPGEHQANFSRWVNTDYDAIVDEMYVTPIDDQAALQDQFRRAMEIWLPELPDIQIQEWYHRIPMNQTYWTGWPTQDDPYVNGAFWHLTFQLILNRLAPAQ